MQGIAQVFRHPGLAFLVDLFDSRPVIHHFYARQSGLASEVLVRALSIPREAVLDRIALGSLYVRRKRMVRDEIVLEGDYVRFHDNPKRFRIPSMDWASRLVENNDEFVIVNKPGGMPSHQTLDNIKENLRYELSKFLKCELLITHRLDQPTSGLLVFAKTQQFQKRFNRWLEKGKVSKKYLAQTEKPIPLGLHTHWMEDNKRVPKTIQAAPFPGALECRLIVESCERNLDGYEVKVQLLTGRTHQIRAQFSFLGAPILGDVLYGASSGFADETIALTAVELSFGLQMFRLTAPR